MTSSLLSPLSSRNPTFDGDFKEIEKDEVGILEDPSQIAATTPTFVAKLFLFFKKLIIGFSLGIIFGFVLYRSGVMLPAAIRGQFIFTRFVMLKMWLTAVGFSGLFHIISFHLRRKEFDNTRRVRPWSNKGLATTIIGSLIQGVGMAFCGTCPGIVMGQITSGVPDSWLVLIGAIIGALFHIFVDAFFANAQIRDFKRTYAKFKTGYLDKNFGIRYDVAAFGLFLIIAAIVTLFEYFFPWETDLVGVPGSLLAGSGLLNPTAAGLCVASLVIPAFFLLNYSFLGTSSAYSIFASQWIRISPNQVQQTFTRSYGMMNSSQYWQIFYVAGIALGAYIGSITAAPPSVPPRGVGTAFALIGGFLLLFGARLCGGCATGHGVTGISIFSITGWISVAGMFGGAISTSFILTQVLGYTEFGLV